MPAQCEQPLRRAPPNLHQPKRRVATAAAKVAPPRRYSVPPAVNGGSVHRANIALFGNYMAGFVTEAGSHGGSVMIDSASAESQPSLTYLHHR